MIALSLSGNCLFIENVSACGYNCGFKIKEDMHAVENRNHKQVKMDMAENAQSHCDCSDHNSK